MRGLLFASLGSLLLSYCDAANDDQTCKIGSGGKFYDLSSLASKHDYVLTSHTGTKYTINVCTPVTSEIWNLKDVKQDTVGGFFRGEHGDMSMGAFTPNLTIIDDEPYMYMKDGSPCPGAASSNLRASTAIRFICDSSMFSSGSPKLVAQLPPKDFDSCAYFIEWRTPVACASILRTGTVGLIGVFFSILFIAILVLLLGSIGYNRYVLGYRGADQLPSLHWLPSPSRLTFGLQNIIHGILDAWDDARRSSSYGGRWGSWGGGGGGSGRGYGRLPTEADERAGFVGDARFSIDEEDDVQESQPPVGPDGRIVYNDIDQQKLAASGIGKTRANGNSSARRGAR